MKRSATMWLVAAACGLLTPTRASGEQVVRSIEWQELKSAGSLRSGTVVTAADAGGSLLRLVHKGTAPVTLPLVTIERPAITRARYALKGRVRYEAVAAGSYLEMWTHLPEGAFFSRTMAPGGPMGRLEGSSGWRAFVLPFTNREDGPPPARLVFNLVLAGPGTVDIGPVELVQFGAGEMPIAASSDAWWDGRQAGLIGAIGGSVMGGLGAVVGWLASAGRARRFVFATLALFAWMGLGALVAGAIAVMRGQPYDVYYPLGLLGTIGAAIGFGLPRSLSRRYEHLELQRMRALDA